MNNQIPAVYLISEENQAKEFAAAEKIKNTKINTVGITSYDDEDTCYRNLWPEPDAGITFYKAPVKEMSDIYEHLKAKLNFHETAKDNKQQYHRDEADDIRYCINWLEVKHGLRTI